MKMRTIYLKSNNIMGLCNFWGHFLEVAPHKDFEEWKELWCGNIRLGFLKLDENNVGSNCVPVFEFEDSVLDGYVERAIKFGATMIEDGRNNPQLLSAVMKDPFGNEFELSKFHD
jgi:hypothetical protein